MSLKRLLACSCFTLAGALFCSNTLLAQVEPSPKRDTIVIVKRDTVYSIQRDTVFMVQTDTLKSQTSSDDTDEERLSRAELRREELMQKRRERLDRLESLPEVRIHKHAWAYHYYPTRIYDFDFPAVAFGANYVKDGRIGLTAILGFLLSPNLTNQNNGPNQGGTARYGVRGIDLGLEFRYLVSPLRDREPFYFSIGASGTLAPVTFDQYVVVPDGSYRRFTEVNASGQRFEFTGLLGWDGRFGEWFALDVALGADIGFKGLFSSNEDFINTVNTRFLWNTAGQFNGYFQPVIRVGVGFGKW